MRKPRGVGARQPVPLESEVRPGRRRFLPTDYCYFGDAGTPGARYCRADSNGCAAGNTLTEAVLHGLLELVERDCVAVWWYNRLRRPAVDLASFDEPYIDCLLGQYAQLGREVWVLDLTHDLGIPAFVAVSRRTEPGPELVLMGFGAHLDVRVGLLRALTELNQMLTRPSALDVPPDQVMDQVELTWAQKATVANQPYLAPDPALAPRRRSDFADPPRPVDLLGAVDRCRAPVEDRGMEVLVLDQTRPDIELPVAKVFVPGLRHFWARFAPGRLYDVPVRHGWLAEPLREDQLNPVPMFL